MPINLSIVQNLTLPTTRRDYQQTTSNIALLILLTFVGLAVAALTKEINKKFKISSNILVLIIGILIGFFKNELDILGKACINFENIDPEGILMIFIPILIFETAFRTNFYVIKKS